LNDLRGSISNRGKIGRLAGLAAMASLIAVACSSNSSSRGTAQSASSSDSPGVSAASVDIGVISDQSGAFESTFAGVDTGVEARLALQNAAGGVFGRKLVAVPADDESSASQNLLAAQELIEQKRVFGIIEVSGFDAGSYEYVAKAGVPLTSAGLNSPQYGEAAYSSLFTATGSPALSFPAATTYGTALTDAGATRLGTVAYTIVNSSAAAKSVSEAAASVGIPTSYANSSVPETGANYTTIALGLKQAHVDAVFAPLGAADVLSLTAALQDVGSHLKVLLSPTGYGRQLLASPGALPSAEYENLTFANIAAPLELGTPATKVLAGALLKYGGIHGDPTYGEMSGYLAADLFIRGLQAAGAHPNRPDFVSGLRNVTDYNASGLEASADLGKFGVVGPALGQDNCVYMVRVTNGAFSPVAGENPVCGHIIPNAGTKSGST
jgi:branched-chain amino acid transport system substrate-binding protein